MQTSYAQKVYRLHITGQFYINSHDFQTLFYAMQQRFSDFEQIIDRLVCFILFFLVIMKVAATQ